MHSHDDSQDLESRHLMSRGSRSDDNDSRRRQTASRERLEVDPDQAEPVPARTMDAPLSRETAAKVVRGAVGFQFFLSVGIIIACTYEATDSRNAQEYCPLLYVGIGVGGVSAAVALMGCFGLFYGDLHVKGRRAFLYVHHTFSLLVFLLLLIVAVTALLHWDVGGQPSSPVLHRPETVGIRHRYVIWGLALATALAVGATILGILSLDWDNDSKMYRYTFIMTCIYTMLIGFGLIALTIVVYKTGEIKNLPHPVWVIGSGVCGGLIVSIAIFGMALKEDTSDPDGAEKMRKKLSVFLWLMGLGSLLTLIFCVGDAVLGEDDPKNQRTVSLLQGLVGLWGQLNTFVVITTASFWRYTFSAHARNAWRRAIIA